MAGFHFSKPGADKCPALSWLDMLKFDDGPNSIIHIKMQAISKITGVNRHKYYLASKSMVPGEVKIGNFQFEEKFPERLPGAYRYQKLG